MALTPQVGSSSPTRHAKLSHNVDQLGRPPERAVNLTRQGHESVEIREALWSYIARGCWAVLGGGGAVDADYGLPPVESVCAAGGRRADGRPHLLCRGGNTCVVRRAAALRAGCVRGRGEP